MKKLKGPATYRRGELITVMVSRISDSETVTPTDIAQRLGIPVNRVNQALPRAINKGYLEKISTGIYRKVPLIKEKTDVPDDGIDALWRLLMSMINRHDNDIQELKKRILSIEMNK